MKDIIIFIAAIIFGLMVGTVYKAWSLGDHESDYETICIGGHEYWTANFLMKGLITTKMDDDGLPIKCNLKVEK